MTVVVDERVILDDEHPWPGLTSFDEAAARFFRGREQDRKELFALISRSLITVVYGFAGLGKTSLLQAGVFPLLREANMFPIPVRLEFGDVPLIEQVFDAIMRETGLCRVTMPPRREAETLWEFFHRRSTVFWNERHRILRPVLVFDQFEELFTIGKDKAIGRAEFFQQLAGLAAGRPSSEVLDFLSKHSAIAESIEPATHRYGLVVSLREDYLGDLDTLRAIYPAFDTVRKRVTRMNGENALQVVRAVEHLVDSNTAHAIVSFVATGEMASDQPLREMEVEPALLSVVCAELNKKRLSATPPMEKIEKGLLETNRDSILANFYQNAMAEFEDRPQVRRFIEEGLLTPEGNRATMSEDQVKPFEIDEKTIRDLVKQRLVRIEPRGRVRRVELTHDLLTKVIAESRDRRRAEEAKRAEEELEEARRREEREREEVRQREERERLRRRRLRVTTYTALSLAIGLVALVLLLNARLAQAKREREEAKRVRARHTFRAAVSHLDDGRVSQALAHLASAVRDDPDNVPARRLATSVILDHVWYAPRASWDFTAPVRFVRFTSNGKRVLVGSGKSLFIGMIGSPPVMLPHAENITFAAEGSGNRIVTAAGQTIRVWEGSKLGRAWDVSGGQIDAVSLSANRSLVATVTDEEVAVWDLAGNRKLLVPRTDMNSLVVKFSADDSTVILGEEMWLDDAVNVTSWSLTNGKKLRERKMTTTSLGSFDIDAVNARLATASSDGLQLWSLDAAEPKPLTIAKSAEDLANLAFSPDGTWLLGIADRSVHSWLMSTAITIATEFPDSLDVVENVFGESIATVSFSADSRLVLTAGVGGELRTWTPKGVSLTAPVDREVEIGVVAISSDGAQIAGASGRTVRLLTTPGLLQIAVPASAGYLSGNEKTVYVRTTITDGLEALDASTGMRQRSERVAAGRHYSLAISPQRNRLAYIPSGENVITLIDFDTGRTLSVPNELHPLSRLAFSGDGSRLIVVDTRTFGAIVYDAATGRRLRHFDDEIREGLARAWSISFDGTKLAVITGSGNLVLLDVETGGTKELAGDFHSVEFDRTTARVIATAGDTARVFDTAKLRSSDALPHGASVWFAAFSRDAEAASIVTISEDRRVRVWRRNSGNRGYASYEHAMHLDDPSASADFSADGTRLVTMSVPSGPRVRVGAMRVWDSDTGAPLTAEYQARAMKMVFGELGQRLVVSGQNFARVIEMRDAGTDESPLLAELAEFLAGARLDEDGNLKPTSDLNLQVPENLKATDTAKLIAMFQSSGGDRTITPFTHTKLSAYVRERLENASDKDAGKLALSILYPGAVPP